MNDPIATTPAAIQKAGDRLKQIRPAYDQIVDYYQKVFIEQESAKNAVRLTPVRIPESHLEAKLKEFVSESLVVEEAPDSGEEA